MYLIFALLFSGKIQAEYVLVNYKNFHYKINYSHDKLVYTAPNTELSLTLKKCNMHILKDFRTKLEANLKGSFLNKPSVMTYSLSVDDVKKYDLLTSNRSLYFAKFDEYFKTLKIEESLSCIKD